MKIKLILPKNQFTSEQLEVLDKFIHFLFFDLPIKKDCIIEFVNKRKNGMTTGQRGPNSYIKILVSNRMFIDILRTLSHEWVHEFQIQNMGVNPKEVIDIGGKEENMANRLSGIHIKKFQKKYPKFEKLLYNEN